MHVNEIVSLIDEREADLVVLLCHHNADPDAICAAYALSRLLKHLRPKLNMEIGAAQGPSKLSRALLPALPAMLVEQPRIEEADVIVLVDTNTIQQLDDWSRLVQASNAPIVVVDHHARHPETERLATLSLTDEDASSTCEFVYQFFQEAGIEPTKTEAMALFLGIAFDTRHFILANSSTLKVVADLLDAGVDAKETLSLLSLPMEHSERIARLKASRRVRLTKVGDWLIAISQVGAYQASAARALVALGAHVAIVAGERENKLQVSLRASDDFHKRTGIHLGRDLANPLGEYLQGMGGGHAVSAGANGIGEADATLNRCVKLLKDRLT